mgnify:CR=1 FL=1
MKIYFTAVDFQMVDTVIFCIICTFWGRSFWCFNRLIFRMLFAWRWLKTWSLLQYKKHILSIIQWGWRWYRLILNIPILFQWFFHLKNQDMRKNVIEYSNRLHHCGRIWIIVVSYIGLWWTGNRYCFNPFINIRY